MIEKLPILLEYPFILTSFLIGLLGLISWFVLMCMMFWNLNTIHAEHKKLQILVKLFKDVSRGLR